MKFFGNAVTVFLWVFGYVIFGILVVAAWYAASISLDYLTIGTYGFWTAYWALINFNKRVAEYMFS